MKLLVIFSILIISVFCEIDLKTFDWSSVKPLHEIQEWRSLHKNLIRPSIEVNQQRNGRIIDGEIASPTTFPYMVGILLHFDSGNSFCGGTLISRRFVLTAANCVHIVPSASVLLGASNMMGNIEANIKVDRIRVHPEYSHDQSRNDIATLELSREAVLSNTINLVRLPNRRQIGQNFVNQEGTIAG
jgi:secreted trypsin-like serine protease